MWGNDTGARIPVHTKSQFARNQLAGKIGHQQEEQQHHSEQQIPSSPSSYMQHHQSHHQNNQKKKIYINSGEETPPDYRQGTLSNMGIGGFLNSDVVPIHSTKRSRPNPNGVPHHQQQKQQQQQQPYFHPPSAEQEAKNREMMLLKNNKNNDDDNVSPLPRLKGNDNDNKDQNDDEQEDPLLHIQQSPSHPLISPNRIRARNEYMNSEGVMSAILDNHQPINSKKNNHQQTKTSMTPTPKQMNTETLLQQQQQQQEKRFTSATPDTNINSKIHQVNINNNHARRHLQLDDELSHLNHIPSIVRQQNAPSRREPQPQPHQMLLPFQLNSNNEHNNKPSLFVSSPQQHQKKVGGAARYYQNLTSSDNNDDNYNAIGNERYQNNIFSPSPSSSPSKFVSRFPISRTSGLTNFLSAGSSSSSPFPRNGNNIHNNNNFINSKDGGDLTTLVWNNHNEAAHSHLDFNPSKPFEMGGPLANLALASNYYDHDSGKTNNADVEQEEKLGSVAGLNESSQNSPGQTNL